MKLCGFLSSKGFVGKWFSSGRDQLEQPKKYMDYLINNSFLQFLVDEKLKESVTFLNGGELRLTNLTELNARSARADYLVFDEEAQALEAAYRAGVSILSASELGMVFHISTPVKASIFEENYDRLRRRELIHGEQFIFSRRWDEAGFLAKKREWYEEQQKILPDWYFRQEHCAEFTLPLGGVFQNVVYDVYDLVDGEYILKLPLILDKRVVSGLDWNPVSGHWIAGGQWLENMQGFLVTHAFPIAVGYSHELTEAAYEKIKYYAVHKRILAIEEGGINEAFVRWFKEWFGKDYKKRDVNVRYEEWDSSNINKTNNALEMLDKTIYVDRIRFPDLAKQIEDCRWVAESTKLELEKDPIDSPHALDAFLHAINRTLLKDQGLRRFDWYGSS